MKLQNVVIEAASPVKKVIGLYPGRFQPFGQHHAKAYEWMGKQFGPKNTYVVTSNVQDDNKSPFSFIEKKKIINSHGITKVRKVKNPYRADEVVSRFDDETTAIVFGFSEKDAGRIAGSNKSYFKPYDKNKNKLKPYTENAYFIIIPRFSFNVPGFGEMSGTSLRKAFGSTKMGSERKMKIFKAVFGHTKKSIYNLVVKKLGGSL
jgi:hypothetical protein|tara:strand:+ start:291 stop:905 length:615 start_codon:yes stop_codon:yes gene_type:complete